MFAFLKQENMALKREPHTFWFRNMILFQRCLDIIRKQHWCWLMRCLEVSERYGSLDFYQCSSCMDYYYDGHMTSVCWRVNHNTYFILFSSYVKVNVCRSDQIMSGGGDVRVQCIVGVLAKNTVFHEYSVHIDTDNYSDHHSSICWW